MGYDIEKEILRGLGFKDTREKQGLFKKDIGKEETGLKDKITVFVDFRKNNENIYASYWHNGGWVDDSDRDQLTIIQQYWQIKQQKLLEPTPPEQPKPEEPKAEFTPASEVPIEEKGPIVEIIAVNVTGNWRNVPVYEDVAEKIYRETFEENSENFTECMSRALAICECAKIDSKEAMVSMACALFKGCMKCVHFEIENHIKVEAYRKAYPPLQKED